jgi:N-acetylglucosamine kinase-like BadF-type ATPase
VAIDVGGTGARLTACRADGSGRYSTEGPRASVNAEGSAAGDSIRALLADLAAARPALREEGVLACAGGVTGLVTLVGSAEPLHRLLRDMTGAEVTALAADFVTAHLAALRGAAGAVLSAGTGAVALGTDFDSVWRRVDGWGHLIGDLGGGVWIGMAALRAAAAALDGRASLGSPGLAERAVGRFGPVESWPVQLYTAGDRAGRMAAFADDVARLAAAGDAIAGAILARAAELLAQTLNAALVPGADGQAAYSGGLFRLGAVLVEPFEAAFRQLRPGVSLCPAAGSPLDGAMALARRLADGDWGRPHEAALSIQRHQT